MPPYSSIKRSMKRRRRKRANRKKKASKPAARKRKQRKKRRRPEHRALPCAPSGHGVRFSNLLLERVINPLGAQTGCLCSVPFLGRTFPKRGIISCAVILSAAF